MTDVDRGFEVMIAQLFESKVGHERVLEAEQVTLLRDLWDTASELGLPWIGINEEAGGSGGSIQDLVTLLDATGRFAVPLPLLENHLAAWLVTSAGGQVAEGEIWSVAPGTPQDSLVMVGSRVSGTVHDVAWGGAAHTVVVLIENHDGTQLVLLDPTQAEVTPGRDIAGQPRDVMIFDGAEFSPFISNITVDDLRQRGAVLRAAQMAGAMATVYETTKRYTAERHQFGRPIGTFQAVRTHLVYLAQAAVVTRVSVDRAAVALDAEGDASFAAYATKLLANQNAAQSIRSGHQAHGAIGMTREYSLQEYTRRLNAWRGDWGTEYALAERIGGAALEAHRIATIATDERVLTV
jgi:acyl-CoA dehydrogenase